ncbi:MAG: HDIG domain-containing protein [Prevotellaceae bacterium]|jgi:uncharacterized protein|nr:HDIG domain-containing protein [Prevotellaceae bacterium]
MNPFPVIDKYYVRGSNLYNLLLEHSGRVALKSVSVCYRHPELNADMQFVIEAAFLHDIGIFRCYAPSIFCFGSHKYIEHGYLGAQILEREGFPQHARVAERHTGTGISLAEIEERNLPLPHRDFCPQTIEEKIVCYADKFFSKTQPDRELSLAEVRKHLRKFGEKKLVIFDGWHGIFG